MSTEDDELSPLDTEDEREALFQDKTRLRALFTLSGARSFASPKEALDANEAHLAKS